MSRLGLTLVPQPREVPQGFAARLAARYGIGLAQFCQELGLSLQGVVDGRPDDLAALAGLAGLEPADLLPNAFVKEGDRRILRGEVLDRQSLRRARLCACPACLEEDVARSSLPPPQAAFFRAEWLVEPIRTCPAHGLGLVDVDGGPGTVSRTMSIHDLATRAKDCLQRLGALLARAPARRASALETYLMGRLDGRRAASWLDGLTFFVAARTCQMIGVTALLGKRPSLRRLGEADWQAAGGAGFEIASGGEPAVRRFLSGLQGAAAASGADGPQRALGLIYQWLSQSATGVDFEPVRLLVRTHVFETMPMPAGRPVLGVALDRRRIHSVRSAAKETGCHPKRLRRILINGGIITSDQDGKTDNMILFDAERAAGFLALSVQQVSLRAATKYLNAPFYQVARLAEAGIIEPFVSTRMRQVSRYAFSEVELDRFLTQLLIDAKHPAEPDSLNVLDIRDAAKRANCSTVDIVRLILGRKLGWVGRRNGETGFSSVLVDVREVRRLVRGPPVEGMQEVQIIDAMRVNHKAVRALMKAGLLPTRTVTNPGSRLPMKIVASADVKAFQDKYVALFQLAREQGVYFRKVLETLRARGIEPALPKDLFHCSFYLRLDLTH